MSRYERYGYRNLTFSRWHRTLPDHCTTIDIDFLEYCRQCHKPLALIEIAQDVGQDYKPTTVLKALSRLANIPAFLIFYEIKIENELIGNCRWQRIWPEPTALTPMTMDQIGKWIVNIHNGHNCSS